MTVIGITSIMVLIGFLYLRSINKSNRSHKELESYQRKLDEAEYKYLRACRKGDVKQARRSGREYYLLLHGVDVISVKDEKRIEEEIESYSKNSQQ